MIYAINIPQPDSAVGAHKPAIVEKGYYLCTFKIGAGGQILKVIKCSYVPVHGKKA